MAGRNVVPFVLNVVFLLSACSMLAGVRLVRFPPHSVHISPLHIRKVGIIRVIAWLCISTTAPKPMGRAVLKAILSDCKQ